MTMSEDTEVCGIKLMKGDPIIIGINPIHHNPKEWIDHDKFIPERFDPSSPYYLTPAGKKRNPMSYVPFLGGKRICLGKTFSDVIAKVISAAILKQFDFEFVNPEHYIKKPRHDFSNMVRALVMMKVKA